MEDPIQRLNRTYVESLPTPSKGERVFMDTEVPSFGIRVMPSGVKSYFVRYRIGGGRQAQMRRETLGRHPVLTPEKARQRAKDALAKARLGEDPVLERRRQQAAMSVGDLVAEWVAGPGKRTRKGRPKSAASFASDKARLEQHVVPLIGKVKLCDLNRTHVERVRDGVAKGATARDRVRTKTRGYSHVRGGEGVATRTTACFSTLLGYAVEQGYIAANPAIGVHRQQERKCERFLSPDEIASLQRALSAHEACFPTAVRILRLLLLTGCRFNEIAQLTWGEVNLHAGVITLKKAKTGARVVYLSVAAVEVLKSVPQVDGVEQVFPASSGGRHYQGTPKVWRSVLAQAGLADVRIHDLRHTFASTALAEGASLEVVAKLLGHAELRTTARYAHLAADTVRAAANRVGVAVGGQKV